MKDQATAEQAVRDLIEFLGEDVEREGLCDTPKRVVKAFQEMTEGYQLNPKEVLSRTFDVDDCVSCGTSCDCDHDTTRLEYGGMVLLKDIDMVSLCEHHLLPFIGKAHIAYIPGVSKRVVGISKLARLVRLYARRLQVQERLTAQIADAIQQYLEADGVMVVIKATHMCMQVRGVKTQNATMITSEVRGVFKEDLNARQEALNLIV